MYSEMYPCILWFAIGIHCALCILAGVFCMYPTCILSRGWNTLGYTENTLRYTYPPPHTWPGPCASGIHQDTMGYNRIHPLVRIPTGCTRGIHHSWGIHAAMMYPIVAGEIHAGYIQDTCWIQRSMCILEESIRHMQDTCGIHAGYIQDTCSKDVSSRGLWDTCEIHAGYSLQTCILR